MTGRFLQKSLIAAAPLLIAQSIAIPGVGQPSAALARAPHPEFEVVSIKPNTTVPNIVETPPPAAGGRLTWTNASLKAMIGIAYQVRMLQITGGPAWLATVRYDVNGRGRCAVADPNKPPPLPDKLAPGSLPARCGSFNLMATKLEGSRLTAAILCDALSRITGRQVIDKTGYSATFDVHLQYTRESTVFAGNHAAKADASGPSSYTALQEQLGLKLESQKGTAEVLVVDHAEKPSAN